MIAPDDPRHGTRSGYRAGCRRGDCPLPERRDCTHDQTMYVKRWRIGLVQPTVPAVVVQRRVRALCALGWSQHAQAERLGVTESAVGQFANASKVCTAATAAAIGRLYDELSMTPGPSRKARLLAERRGWAPPLAWDEDTINDPDAKPYKARKKGADPEFHQIDPVIIDRAMNGRRVKANPTERTEVIRRWLAAGRSRNALEAAQGWNTTRDNRKSAAA